MHSCKVLKLIISVLLIVTCMPVWVAWGDENPHILIDVDEVTGSSVSSEMGNDIDRVEPDRVEISDSMPNNEDDFSSDADALFEDNIPTSEEEMASGGSKKQQGDADQLTEESVVNMQDVNAYVDSIVADGLYSIQPVVDESLVLDVASSSPANGAPSCLWKSNNQSNQVFNFQRQDDGAYTIRAYHSDKVLAVSGINAKNGAPVVQWDDNGSANMRWIVQKAQDDSSYRIVSVDTGLCLDFASDSASAGVKCVAWEVTGAQKQAFSLVPSPRGKAAGRTLSDGLYRLALSDDGSIFVGSLGSGYSVPNGSGFETQSEQQILAQKYLFTYRETDGCYTILSLGSGKALAVAGIEARNGASIVQWDDNGTANMRWSVEPYDGGYRIVSKDTSLCMDFSANNPQEGIPCVVWEATGASKQVFSIASTPILEDGCYGISPARAENLRVDVNGGSTNHGTSTILWAINGSLSQKYHFVRNDDDTYIIKTLHSGQQLGISSEGKIVQLPPDTSKSQQWTLTPDGQGGIRLESQADDGSTRAFSTGGNTFSSASVWGDWSDHSSQDQSFSLVSVNILDDGLYTIAPGASSALIASLRNASSTNGVPLDIARDGGLPWSKYIVKNISSNIIAIETSNGKVLAVDASIGNGAPVIQWDNNGTDNMKWKVVPDYNGSVYLTNVQTGMNVDYASNSAAVGDSVVTWSAHFGEKQRWRFSPTTMTSEANAYYDMSIGEMLSYQMDNPYITSSWQEVLSYLAPDHLVTKDGGYYALADIRGYSGLTADQLNFYIASTEKGRAGNLKGMGACFVSAAKKYNLNEMYLLAHAILESGWGTSELASGYAYNGLTPVGGKVYPAGTYYNFYGIGAYDDSPLSGGRSLAIQNGWNSPQAAIEGAALWIALNYANRSDYPQVTLYDMRWDPARSANTGKRSWHQYATSITWASSIGRVMQTGYQYCGIVPDLTFIIPRYSG